MRVFEGEVVTGRVTSRSEESLIKETRAATEAGSARGGKGKEHRSLPCGVEEFAVLKGDVVVARCSRGSSALAVPSKS